MKIDMITNHQIVNKYKYKYRKVKSRKSKSELLDNVCELTGFNRKYASTLLSGLVKTKSKGRVRNYRRKRTKVYDKELLKVLKTFWVSSNYGCSIVVKNLIPHFLENYSQISKDPLDKITYAKLSNISTATIDRLLKQERENYNYKLLKKYGKRKKRNSTLKSKVPVRTHLNFRFRDIMAGQIQIDLVSHDGGNPKGDHIHTLQFSDYKTGFENQVACFNKAGSNVVPNIKEIIDEIPIRIVSLNFDNGSEFLNGHLTRLCKSKSIKYTRSRPFKKDDNFWAENRNNSAVRKNVGYLRYEGKEDLFLLNELYKYLNDYNNYFIPQRRCYKKVRVGGSKIKKLHDKPRTPYVRLLELEYIEDSAKRKLKGKYKSVSPIMLIKVINKLKEISILDKDTRKIAIKTYKQINNLG